MLSICWHLGPWHNFTPLVVVNKSDICRKTWLKPKNWQITPSKWTGRKNLMFGNYTSLILRVFYVYLLGLIFTNLDNWVGIDMWNLCFQNRIRGRASSVCVAYSIDFFIRAFLIALHNGSLPDVMISWVHIFVQRKSNRLKRAENFLQIKKIQDKVKKPKQCRFVQR